MLFEIGPFNCMDLSLFNPLFQGYISNAALHSPESFDDMNYQKKIPFSVHICLLEVSAE